MTSRLVTAVTSDGLIKEALTSLIMEEPETYNFKSKKSSSKDSDDESDYDSDSDGGCYSDDSDCSDDEKESKKKSGWLPAPIVYPVLLAGQIF